MSTESHQNFDLVAKEVNLRAHKRKKTQSKKSERTLLYGIWFMIKDRCLNPMNEAYERYGGRGILPSDQWIHDFETFLHDMGPRPSMFHSVERRNNSEGYCKKNCYWGTPSDQTRNKRNNIWVEFRGKKMILRDVANAIPMNYLTLYQRFTKYKWPLEKCINHPSKSRYLVYYNGSLYTRRGLCKFLGVDFNKMHGNIRKGETLKQAFELCLGLQATER